MLLDINKTLLEQTVSKFKNKGFIANGYVADVSSESSVQGAIQQVEDKFGKIGIMVNSAGFVDPTSTKIVDYPLEEYDKINIINLRGSFLMSKYAIKPMGENNYRWILLLASLAGKKSDPFLADYSSRKAGVILLVKVIGKEYAQTGITVNGLAWAVIKTAMHANAATEQLSYMKAKIPMGPLGTVPEVASIASWIIFREASFNTGFIFDILGGRATY